MNIGEIKSVLLQHNDFDFEHYHDFSRNNDKYVRNSNVIICKGTDFRIIAKNKTRTKWCVIKRNICTNKIDVNIETFIENVSLEEAIAYCENNK